MANRNEAFPAELIKGPGGILILGAFNSGVEALGSALHSISTEMTATASELDLRELTELNDLLLTQLGGSVNDLPAIAPSEIANVLDPWTSNGLEVFQRAFGSAQGSGPGSSPWVWADPRNAILAPFWTKTLDGPVAAVLVHRSPDEILNDSDRSLTPPSSHPADLWERYNRSALAVTASIPTLVVGYRDLVEDSEDVYARLLKFLTETDTATEGWGDAKCFQAEIRSAISQIPVPRSDVPHHISVLDQLLTQYEIAPPSRPNNGYADENGIVGEVTKFYDANYYLNSYDTIPYSRDEEHWITFFDQVAGHIVNDLAPVRSLDVGCAIGMLVEALRGKGVEAFGIDVSEWALQQVPESIKSFCTLGSITDDISGEYDLITCIEVLEHLPRPMANRAVGNLCAHTDVVLFSSTPDEFGDPTHLNVESPAYWSIIFATHGFFRDFGFDASFLAPQAVLYRRGPLDLIEVVDGYERVLRNVSTTLYESYRHAVQEHDALAVRLNHLELNDEAPELRRHLLELETRRSAEANAASITLLDYEYRQHALAGRLEEALAELNAARDYVEALHRTRIYRYTHRIRTQYFRRRTAKRVPEFSDPQEVAPIFREPTYALWVETYDTIDEAARDRLRRSVAEIAEPPLISILLPVYNTPTRFLEEAVDSVRQQIYSNWELCIVDDCSTDPSIAPAMEHLATVDHRIKFLRRDVNGHISAASNSALSMANGSWVACLDHDDRLAEHALAEFALAIDASPHAAVLFSDEDKLTEDGSRNDPFFKPEFDPELLMGQNYLCHLSMYRKELVDQVGGYREGYEGSQDWDLALRATEGLSGEQIIHIPRILYHWRVHPGSTAKTLTAKSYAAGSGQRAVRDHLDRIKAQGEVIPLPSSGWNRVRWHLPEPIPLVSIIIPTRDGDLLSRCLESIRHRSTYPHMEIVILDNGSLSRSSLEYLRVNESWLTVIRDEGPFNYPEINNHAVSRSSGEVICLLNDDTEVLAADWLEEMVSHLYRPSVGAVGAKLYYSSGEIQHAGVVLGIGGVAGHAFRMSDRLSPGDHGRMQLAHQVSAVTAACMVVRREAWNQIGGMDAANLPVAFNDIDFCLRLGEAGWRVLWTPYAELIHHESISRGPDTEGERAVRFSREIRYMKDRWGTRLREDPAYSPNLSLINEHFDLAWPPRVPKL